MSGGGQGDANGAPDAWAHRHRDGPRAIEQSRLRRASRRSSREVDFAGSTSTRVHLALRATPAQPASRRPETIRRDRSAQPTPCNARVQLSTTGWPVQSTCRRLRQINPLTKGSSPRVERALAHGVSVREPREESLHARPVSTSAATTGDSPRYPARSRRARRFRISAGP